MGSMDCYSLPLHHLVLCFINQQCHWEDTAQSIPLPDDCDRGSAVINSRLLGAAPKVLCERAQGGRVRDLQENNDPIGNWEVPG